MNRFVRTTHDANGDPKKFSPEAQKAWREGHGFVGHMLYRTSGITFDELAELCHQYDEQWNEGPMTDYEIAYHLVRLIEFGMAGVICDG